MKFYYLAAAPALTSANPWFMTVDFNYAGQEVVDAALNNTALATNLMSHGCWCAKLDPTNDPTFLGGPDALDDLDDICKRWFMCRHCNDKLIGGSCSNSTVYPDLAAETYEVAELISQTENQPPVCQTTNSQTGETINNCSYDSCLIDVEYMSQIEEYLRNNPSFTFTEVTTGSQCSTPLGAYEHKECQGVAPFLRTVTLAPPEPIVAASSAQAVSLCENEVMDIYFLVDGSGSMTPSGYAEAISVTQNMVDLLDIEPNFTRVSIIQYSSSVKSYCNHCTTYAEVTNAITAMGNDYFSSGTSAGLGLSFVYNMMTNSPRPNTKQVLLVINDGASGDDVVGPTNQLNSIPSTNFVLGIGSNINMAQVEYIASSPIEDHLFQVTFGNLETIKLGITSGMCQTNL